jgi:hypothetical protein
MESIKDILVRRDGLTKQQAQVRMIHAHQLFNDMLMTGEDGLFDFCEDQFGLESDYLDEFL